MGISILAVRSLVKKVFDIPPKSGAEVPFIPGKWWLMIGTAAKRWFPPTIKKGVSNNLWEQGSETRVLFRRAFGYLGSIVLVSILRQVVMVVKISNSKPYGVCTVCMYVRLNALHPTYPC